MFGRRLKAVCARKVAKADMAQLPLLPAMSASGCSLGSRASGGWGSRPAHLSPCQACCPVSISCSSTPAEKMSTSGLSRPSLIISGDM